MYQPVFKIVSDDASFKTGNDKIASNKEKVIKE